MAAPCLDAAKVLVFVAPKVHQVWRDWRARKGWPNLEIFEREKMRRSGGVPGHFWKHLRL
jgi:hypothetical protein